MRVNFFVIRLENLVYQTNPVHQYYTACNTQSTEYYKGNISKHISFPFNICLTEISRYCFLNPANLTAFLFGFSISEVSIGLRISILFPIQERPVLALQVCSYHLNIGHDQLNIVNIMWKPSSLHWGCGVGWRDRASYHIFKKSGLDRMSVLGWGLLRKRGLTFFRRRGVAVFI